MPTAAEATALAEVQGRLALEWVVQGRLALEWEEPLQKTTAEVDQVIATAFQNPINSRRGIDMLIFIITNLVIFFEGRVRGWGAWYE